MSEATFTPGSIAALAEAARMMPWEKSVVDVPFNARYAFQQAITADHYMELLEALQEADWYIGQLELLVYSADDTGTHESRAKVQAAIAKALGEPSHG